MTFYVSYSINDIKYFATINAINALDLHKVFKQLFPNGVIIDFEKAKVEKKR